jgi:hypothetical protein
LLGALETPDFVAAGQETRPVKDSPRSDVWVCRDRGDARERESIHGPVASFSERFSAIPVTARTFAMA